MRYAKKILLYITGILFVVLIGFVAVYAQQLPPPPPSDDTDVTDDSDLTILKEDEPLDERELDMLDPWFLENEPNTVDKDKKKEEKDPDDMIRKP
jgi:hypothetical protein